MEFMNLDHRFDSPVDSRQEFKQCSLNVVILLPVNITITVIKRHEQKTLIYFEVPFMSSLLTLTLFQVAVRLSFRILLASTYLGHLRHSKV